MPFDDQVMWMSVGKLATLSAMTYAASVASVWVVFLSVQLEAGSRAAVSCSIVNGRAAYSRTVCCWLAR